MNDLEIEIASLRVQLDIARARGDMLLNACESLLDSITWEETEEHREAYQALCRVIAAAKGDTEH